MIGWVVYGNWTKTGEICNTLYVGQINKTLIKQMFHTCIPSWDICLMNEGLHGM